MTPEDAKQYYQNRRKEVENRGAFTIQNLNDIIFELWSQHRFAITMVGRRVTGVGLSPEGEVAYQVA